MALAYPGMWGSSSQASLFGVVLSSREQYSGGRSSCKLTQPTLPAGGGRMHQPNKGHFGGVPTASDTGRNGSRGMRKRMINKHFSTKDDPNKSSTVPVNNPNGTKKPTSHLLWYIPLSVHKLQHP